MTNAGLHIELLMSPVTARILIPNTTNGKEQCNSIFSDLSFAFLACKSKKGDRSVAVCLRKDDRAMFPRYSRIPFDGQTVYRLDQLSYNRRYIPLTRSIPIWISKAPEIENDNALKRLPFSVKSIHFQLWYKGPAPMERKLTWSCESKNERPMQLEDSSKLFHSLGDQVPREFRELEYPVHYYLSGLIPARGFSHEVIIFQSQKKKGGDVPGCAGIAFGVINGNIWIDFPTVNAEQNCRSLFHDYSFPTGAMWRSSGSTIRVLSDSEGSFYKKQLGRSSRYCGQFVQATEAAKEPKEHSIRIYYHTSPR